MEERFPTVLLSIYSLIKLRESIFRISRATETLVDHDDKTAVIPRGDAKLAAITLVHLQGHSIGATRSHDLHEGTLADQEAPADHSVISVRGTE